MQTIRYTETPAGRPCDHSQGVWEDNDPMAGVNARLAQALGWKCEVVPMAGKPWRASWRALTGMDKQGKV